MVKGVTNIIAEVNIDVEIVLAITRIIVTIVINVGHQIIWHGVLTHHYQQQLLVLGAQSSIAQSAEVIIVITVVKY